MLLVPVVVRPSPLEGNGVFAVDPIPAGTEVWRFEPILDRRITQEEFDALPPVAQDFLRTYAYPSSPGRQDYLLDGDHSRFINHSQTPNLYSTDVSSTALRDIAAGEELLTDYRRFYPEGETFEYG